MPRHLARSAAFARLDEIRSRFRTLVRERYEPAAKSCETCETRGACCLDAHFVNVRISRLEAVAINHAIDDLSELLRASIYQRIDQAVETFGLDESNPDTTYACPLYYREIGCVIHNTAKPLPCINHACYERREDLPPDELLNAGEVEIDALNRKVYGRFLPLMSLPVAIKRVSS